MAQPVVRPSRSRGPRPRWWLSATVTLLSFDLGATALAAQGVDSIAAPLVIDTLYTLYRYDADGTGEEAVHMRARILDQAGVHFLGQLAFGYNQDESVDLEFVRVHKPDGRIIEATERDIQDRSSPVAVEAPVYSDLRLLHVTVPSLAVGDVVSYRFVRRLDKPIAAGQFWLEHTFERFNQVAVEIVELDVPASAARIVGPAHLPADQVSSENGRTRFQWSHRNPVPLSELEVDSRGLASSPDLLVSSFADWSEVGSWYADLVAERAEITSTIRAKAAELTSGLTDPREKVEVLYRYVATEIRYVSISLGVGRYQPHHADDVLRSGYGDCKDKHTLLSALLGAIDIQASPVLVSTRRHIDTEVPSPGQFDHLVTRVELDGEAIWLDTTTEVAPFGFLTVNLRSGLGLVTGHTESAIVTLPADPPFPNRYEFDLDGEISNLGRLTAHIRQVFRGDVEVFLRSVFRRASAQEREAFENQLGYTLGQAGEATSVEISAPERTDEPLTIDFDLSVSGYIDMFDPNLRLASPTPVIDLGELPAEGDSIRFETESVDKVHAIVRLPEILEASPPVSVTVERDYAKYVAFYGVDDNVITVDRSYRLRRQVLPPGRRGDYEAFRRAVASDAKQTFRMERTGRVADGLAVATDVEALHDLGYAALKRGELATAVVSLARVVELAPDHEYGWNNLGRAYLQLDSLDAAVAAFQMQIRINPFDEYANANLGSAFEGLDQPDSAIAAYARHLEIEPLDPFATTKLGMLLSRERRYAEGAPYLERAQTFDPEDGRITVALVLVYAQLERFDDAIDLVRTTGPDSVAVRAYERLTWALIQYGDRESPLILAQEATQLYPEEPLSWAVLGRTAFYLDDFKESKAAYLRVLELDPDWMESSKIDRELWERVDGR